MSWPGVIRREDSAATDSDGPDDGSFAAERTAQLRDAGFPQAHAVVPVQQIEAWWLLHPAATERVVPKWKGALKRVPGDVDIIKNPKAELIRRTRSKAASRPYRESDSPAIARAIAASPMAVPAGISGSFDRFRAAVAGCCAGAAGR